MSKLSGRHDHGAVHHAHKRMPGSHTGLKEKKIEAKNAEFSKHVKQEGGMLSGVKQFGGQDHDGSTGHLQLGTTGSRKGVAQGTDRSSQSTMKG